ncbi:hypothetical protein BC30048_1152 [Bacillus cereus]|jgi:hypothetical protein|uniref:Transporter n=2 Tax=Bacillus cereus group TaxID=86661 RepID=A0A9X7PRU8_BACTU|nr:MULTISPECIES: DUF3899 domain-containing protein [Bacillus cereus group]EEK51882.1 hypothetical protein bcere0002_10520 [Bacillus cereus ATCC 10876]EEK63198.1 hypothetical protein bcere0005_10620 [Bacillus cereus 172560W]EEK90553.1 hypothetical protein bcere0011_10480 [Bacillus cereus m1550]EEK95965.1 hypothetical protein bcere0012_10560 [Bacillus cereus BDRD-ST24]EEL12804.1 hypothetical protein bcere0015_10480 [Bacillus cereus BDRD-Cer4]EEL29918.1 hypothetical protein bcere0018_10220 [Baci
MIASSIGAFLISSQFLLNFVNILFYIALFFILIGGFLYIFQNGFFNVTIYAFQRVFGTNKKIDSLIEEVEEPTDKKERIYKTYSFKWTYPICITGIFLGLFSTLISFTILM